VSTIAAAATLPVARNRPINLIAEDGLTENRAAAPRIELPSLIAANNALA